MTCERDKYRMTIFGMIVDKLGVKLYDRISDVIAELVANGHDADADEITIEAPMGEPLASTSTGIVSDRGHKITVHDNGHGMAPETINSFYLAVGSDRRKDPNRGDLTPKYKRKVTGRKGMGNLAPFGICETLEVVSSGGNKVDGPDRNGNMVRGYRTAHFILHRSRMLAGKGKNYKPEIGSLDGIVQTEAGTSISMSGFDNRQVPDIETFSRQLAQRFKIASANWKINLVDTTKVPGAPDRERIVGDFPIDTIPDTGIILDASTTEAVAPSRQWEFRVRDENGNDIPRAMAGFTSENGRFYPVKGWVGYARESYRDDLMAGIRIYCRGRISARTAVFNKKSGFTGEYDMRRCLVGELHADWLDEEEDLIQTGRRDILWSGEPGCEFEKWGQDIVALVGIRSRIPEKNETLNTFLDTGDVMNRITEIYPGERLKEIREKTIELAQFVGERLRPEEARDRIYVDLLVQHSIALGPRMILDTSLRNAASDENAATVFLATTLRTARIAELSSHEVIAENRMKVIERITSLKDESETFGQVLSDSIGEAPWLLNPFWSPVMTDQLFSTFRTEFEKFVKDRTDKTIHLNTFKEGFGTGAFKKGSGTGRPDFVLSADDFGLQIIHIKPPKHKLKNDEWNRIQFHIDEMDNFLNLEEHQGHKDLFRRFRVILVCDEINLNGAQYAAFEFFRKQKIVEHSTWASFLRRTGEIHRKFLSETSETI